MTAQTLGLNFISRFALKKPTKCLTGCFRNTAKTSGWISFPWKCWPQAGRGGCCGNPAGICSGFAEGSKDTPLLQVLPLLQALGRCKEKTFVFRVWPCGTLYLPAEGLCWLLGGLGEHNSTTLLIPGEEQLWCTPCAVLPCQHGGQARWNDSGRSEEARQECHLVSGCTESWMLAICFTFCWQSWCEKQHSLIRQCQDTRIFQSAFQSEVLFFADLAVSCKKSIYLWLNDWVAWKISVPPDFWWIF